MREKVIEALSEMSHIPADQIKEESRLGGDLGLSSIQLLEMLTILEDEFHVKIDDRKIPDIQVVSDVIRMIEELQH